MAALTSTPSRNDDVTILCPVCQVRRFVPIGRKRVCSPACRQAAFRRRHSAADDPLVVPPQPTRDAIAPSINVRHATPAILACSDVPNAACFADGWAPVGCARNVVNRSPSPTCSMAWVTRHDAGRQDQRGPPSAPGADGGECMIVRSKPMIRPHLKDIAAERDGGVWRILSAQIL